MGAHDSKKSLKKDFDNTWKRLKDSGIQSLQTRPPYSHDFEAVAHVGIRGLHRGEKYVRISRGGKPFAVIYECCWGHTTNCYGTHIGGYSDAIDRWAQ